MATYQIECEKCEIYWEVERSMDNPPKKGKCPQCGKMGNRCFTAPALHFVGPDFYVNQARGEKYAKQGMDKDTANQFLNNSIKASKQNMRQGGQHYKPMFLDEDYAVKKGMAKKASDKQTNAKREGAKELVKEAAKRVKIRDD
jgi:predicted nucleic acid-binding Zn ribbon protein